MQECQKSKSGSRGGMCLDSKRKNVFQFGLHSKNEIPVLPLNLIFYFLKLFNSAVKFEGVIRILHLFLKCM